MKKSAPQEKKRNPYCNEHIASCGVTGRIALVDGNFCFDIKAEKKIWTREKQAAKTPKCCC